MNQHATAEFRVKVKRLDKELPVTELMLLKDCKNHLWGFAEDGHKLVEFDTTWGDKVIQL